MAKVAKKANAGNMNEKVTGGADLSRGFKSLGKVALGKTDTPLGFKSGPTSDTEHIGYRTATGGKAS